LSKKAIIWFRGDLRIHDNESLIEAVNAADHLYPVYVFDERVFHGKTSFGFRKTGIHRARFIIESIHNLRKRLIQKGSNLIVRIGKPEEVLYDLAREWKTSWIFCNRERTYEEVKVQDALERNLWSIGQEVRYNRGKMLYYTSDLPFPVTHTPETFTAFRKEVEKYIPIREPLPEPEELPFIDIKVDAGPIPSLEDLGYEEDEDPPESNFKGGEEEGLRQLNYYLWETDLIATYKKTRNEMLGWDFSSKFSPYLAHGCLSPKKICQEVKRYESQRTSNQSTYWLFFELLWRDFFRLMGKKYGNDIFKLSGPRKVRKAWITDHALFDIWKEGNTGVPIIDANMKEINATGFMSNRGRQNVASFLINDLGVNWLMGAEYFESLLIDYDPCSNYGNWNYLAGVGNDPRDSRSFNILFQSRKYDPQGEYLKHWLPELKMIPASLIHQPDEMSIEQQAEYKCVIGQDYPSPVVNTSRWS
jgi:deoxyribodipyrimidine photo-lyase